MKGLEDTHGVPFELVRHFLRRMFDCEWSSAPGQWRSAAIGAVSLFLPAGLLLVREGAADPRYASKYRLLKLAHDSAGIHAAAVADQLALVTLLLCVTGLIALLQWQSLFPSGRDFLALAALPVRPRQIFRARFTAVLLFSTLIVAAMNLLPSLIAPMEFGGGWSLDSGYAWQATAQAVSSGLACFFIFFAILALQGVLLNLLPGSLFARVSVCVQGALSGVFLLGGFYSWTVKDWKPEVIARLPQFGAWLPPVWFTGLHQSLTGAGDAFQIAMARRALWAAAIPVALAAISYFFACRRYRKLLLESPVHLAAPRTWRFSLLRLLARSPRREAVMEFMAKTMARSRTHRLLWLVYVGAAVAVVLNSSLIDGSLLMRGRGWTQAFRFLVLFWPLACSVVILSGFRHVLSIPAELRANWLFQLTESQGRTEWMSAVERFVMAYAVAPIYVVLFPVAGLVLGWPMAIRMTILQVLLSLSLFEGLFYSWQKLPFTCSYVPGKRPLVALVGIYIVALCGVAPVLSVMIAAASEIPFLFPIYLLNFGGLWIFLRRQRRDGWGEARLLYEDSPSMVTDLGIKELTYAGTEAQLGRTAAGDAGHADSEDADPRPHAWLRGGRVHSADFGGSAAGGGGGALSGAASAGTPRPAQLGMGCLGEQPARQVLPADPGGAQAPGRRGRPLASHVGGDFADYGTGLKATRFGQACSALWLRLRALANRRRLERDLEDELQFHLAMRAAEQGAAGARRRFGNVTAVRENCRDLWTFVHLETWWQDLRYGARQLRRSPAFTAVAAITLGLGIGATTAVFSMLHAVLWQPIPLPHTERLVFVLQAIPGQRFFWSHAAPADIDDLRQATTSLEDLASWQLAMANLVDSAGEALRMECTRVTPNFFEVAGVQPALGRTFRADDDPHEAVLSDSLWRRHFGADPALVGRTIRLDDQNFTVTGIMPPKFYFPNPWRGLWVPFALTPEERHSRTVSLVDSAGRLKPGRTLAQFAAELTGLSSRLEHQYPDTNANRRFMAWTFAHYMGGDLVPIYSALILGSALFVLLIACVNVANLQFARAAERSREVAVRTALGASRWRLLRQLLTESVVLAAAGAAVGLLLARWGMYCIAAGVPAELQHYMPGLANLGIDRQVLEFTLTAALLSGIVSGLLPAWRNSNVAMSLRAGRHRLRSLLIAGQIALAVVLLIGAGLMVRGFQTLVGGSTRVQPRTMLTLRLALTENKYREDYQVAAYYRAVLDRIAALPGVRSSFAVTALPYSRHATTLPVTVDDRPPEPGKPPDAQIQSVTPEYFAALSIPLRAGRLTAASDGPGRPRVGVVSERMARRAPIGSRLRIGANGLPVTVVGVVGDIEHSVIFHDLSPTVYLPFAQVPEREMDIGIRAGADAASLAPAVRQAVHAVDPEQPVANLSTMAELIRQEAFVFAYMAALMGVFGLLALSLSAVGVYGVTASVVAAQTREIGIRLALGAPRGKVLGTLFRRGMLAACAGLAAGLVPAYGLSRFMRATVFGVNAVGTPVFVAIPLALAGAAALAIYIPARQAVRMDPMASLRSE